MNTVVWSDVLTIIVPVCTMALGIHAWFYRLIAAETTAREKALDDVDERLEKSQEDRHKLRNELFVLKERVARENVTHDTLEKFENRLIASIDKLGDRLDKVLTTTHTTVIK